MRVAEHVAADLRKQHDRHDVQARPGQRDRRCYRAEGIGEQQREGAEDRGEEDRQRHHPPVLRTRGAEAGGGLAPLALEPVKRRGDDQDHQRDLEEQIGDGQAPEAEDVEAVDPQVDAQMRLQRQRHQAKRPERGEEGEGERHAGEIRGDAREGQQRRADRPRQPAEHHRRRHQEADKTAKRCRGDRDLDRDPVARQDRIGEQPGDVFEGEAAVGALEGAEHDLHRRRDQEQRNKKREGRKPEPGQGQAPARRGRGIAHGSVRSERQRPPPITGAARGARGPGLLDVRADDLVPAGDDRFLVRALLVERGEIGLGIAFGRRQGVDQLLRDLAGGGHRVEARRVAIALQPEVLALVRVDVFHPQLRRVRMRRMGRDRLHVDTGKHARGRHHDLDRRVAGKRVTRGQRVVVPGHHDRRRALRKRAGLADHRNEVLRVVQLLEEAEALLAGVLAGLAALGQARSEHRENRLVRGARVTRQRHLAGVVGFQQVGPVGRHGVNEVLVHHERHDAVIVAVPVAVGVLDGVRDLVPARDLVGLDQPFFLGLRAEAQTDVDHVGGLRAGVALVGADRLELVGRARVGVQLVHLDIGILGLEAVDHRTIAAPVMRQCDGGQHAFGLRRRLERGHVFGVDERGGGEQRGGACKPVHRFHRHSVSPRCRKPGPGMGCSMHLGAFCDSLATRAPFGRQVLTSGARLARFRARCNKSVAWLSSSPRRAPAGLRADARRVIFCRSHGRMGRGRTDI
ncbi:hypothetical protein SDC9_56429 [bioreactor metagenome]|uniref:Uncharacterized protein n=1 Tax=bioreactor metagenome TaxID=1076179 RepID=A0A644X1R2_9ZZZZ